MHCADRPTESHAEVCDGERDVTSGHQTIGLHGIRGKRGEPAECTRSQAQYGERVPQGFPATEEQARHQCGADHVDGEGRPRPVPRPDGECRVDPEPCQSSEHPAEGDDPNLHAQMVSPHGAQH